jgi:hypothetical protein
MGGFSPHKKNNTSNDSWRLTFENVAIPIHGTFTSYIKDYELQEEKQRGERNSTISQRALPTNSMTPELIPPVTEIILNHKKTKVIYGYVHGYQNEQKI